MKKTFEIELEVPDDYAEAKAEALFTGETEKGYVFTVVLKKVSWRPATAADEGKICRFLEEDPDTWVYRKLLHFDPNQPTYPYLSFDDDSCDETNWFTNCEVQE